MKISPWASIATRLAALTTLLIVAIIGVVVWQWTATERRTLHAQKRAEARAFATTLANALMNELDDENWSQIRIAAELLLQDNPDFVYVLVHDTRRDDLIVAAAPAELAEQYVPELVPLAVTRAALAPATATAAGGGPREAEAFLLADVAVGGVRRAPRGQRLIEVAIAIRIASGQQVGTLRVGISLAAVDRAVAAAVRTALGIGALSLVLGLVGALVLARRLSAPVQRLARDAAKIAAGDLGHRARVDRRDEIGALGTAFNEMSAALETSFGRLRQTLATFERFVPQKFLAVIAPEGIEKIEVGVGSSRRISVLFSDIRGFTKMSEAMMPLDVFNLLNDYLARMGEAINAAGGFVDKYIGDAIMALFDDDHTDGVVDAALGMRRMMRTLNAERLARGLAPLDAGIGAHGGEVVMGTIGFASKIESTVIGDAVNTASRVEGLTKDYGVSVLVTDAIVNGLAHPERYRLRLIEAEVRVRGRATPLALYELQDPADDAAVPAAVIGDGA